LNTSICGAAIHAGVIDNNEGGNIMLHLSNGRESYIGSDANNKIK